MSSTIEKTNTLRVVDSYDSDTIFVFIIHSSVIVREGLAAILLNTTEQIKLFQFENLELFDNWYNKKQLNSKQKSIIFLGTENLNTSNIHHLLFKKILIGITNNVGEIIEKDSVNYTISLYDSDEKIISIYEKALHSLLNKATHEEVELSEREQDVLKLLVLGHSNKEIADRLCISTHTVISHRKNITKKLGIKSVAGLTVYAIINKMVNPENIKLSDLI